MVIFSFNEIFDIMIMSFVIGFVFKDFFKKQMVHTNYDPLAQFNNKSTFFDESFKTALIIIAPAIIFHEFGHKFVAMFFGLSATFHAAYGWLAIALLLKLSGFGFVFLVPAYVSFAGATYYQALWIAFAGPAVNLIFYLISHICIKKKISKICKES